jgi:hypothetical protein
VRLRLSPVSRLLWGSLDPATHAIAFGRLDGVDDKEIRIEGQAARRGRGQGRLGRVTRRRRAASPRADRRKKRLPAEATAGRRHADLNIGRLERRRRGNGAGAAIVAQRGVKRAVGPGGRRRKPRDQGHCGDDPRADDWASPDHFGRTRSSSPKGPLREALNATQPLPRWHRSCARSLGRRPSRPPRWTKGEPGPRPAHRVLGLSAPRQHGPV